MIEAIIFDWTGTLYQKNTALFPDAIHTLNTLKPKYKLGLVSKGGQDIANRIKEIKETGIWALFDLVIVDIEKEQEQFIYCLEQLNVKPENTLVVGDRTLREIRVGNALGCQTYWIKRGRFSHETPTDYTGYPTRTITTASDILEYL